MDPDGPKVTAYNGFIRLPFHQLPVCQSIAFSFLLPKTF